MLSARRDAQRIAFILLKSYPNDGFVLRLDPGLTAAPHGRNEWPTHTLPYSTGVRG